MPVKQFEDLEVWKDARRLTQTRGVRSPADSWMGW